MQRRKYQDDHIDKLIEKVSELRKVLGQLPTGGGKTVEFVRIAQRFNRNTDKSVLILVHREELMYQAQKAVKRIMGINAALITAGENRHLISRVYIGMVESTISRLNLLHNVGLVIIDECHIANFNKMHEIFLEELVIGFSATPISSSKKDPLNKYYYACVAGPQIKELIDMNFLAQNVTRIPDGAVDKDKFKIRALTGDYDEQQMAAEYRSNKQVANVVRAYNKFCKGKKTLIFNVNIDHSKEVAECFSFCGHNAKHLDSDSSKRPSTDPRFRNEREEVLHWFKVTEDAILCNVMIATVGFDEPTVQNVILNFSTIALPKYIQCCGRGSRIIDYDFINNFQEQYPYKLKEKFTFNIIDLGGNYLNFGDWCDDRDWELIFDRPERAGDGVAAVKTCPSCLGLVYAATKVCPLELADGNLCLHEFEQRKTAEQMDLEEFIIVTKGIDIEEVIARSKKKFEYYPFLDMCVPIVDRMFREYSIINDYVLAKHFKMYYALCIEWYNKTLRGKNGNVWDITNDEYHLKRAKNNFDSLVKKRDPNIKIKKSSLVPQTESEVEESQSMSLGVQFDLNKLNMSLFNSIQNGKI